MKGILLTVRTSSGNARPGALPFDCRSGVLGVDTIHYRWVVNAATGARAGTLCRCMPETRFCSLSCIKV